MGNGISYFGASSILYAKTSAGNIKSICLKDSHTNYRSGGAHQKVPLKVVFLT
jgi:hypothetical protein